jgi:hypothetical protein
MATIRSVTDVHIPAEWAADEAERIRKGIVQVLSELGHHVEEGRERIGGALVRIQVRGEKDLPDPGAGPEEESDGRYYDA